MDKKMLASHKADFALHVSLILRTEKVTKPVAIVTAWAEGPTGLGQRLGQLPLPGFTPANPLTSTNPVINPKIEKP